MSRVLCALSGALAMTSVNGMVTSASAQVTSYVFTGAPYTAPSISNSAGCSIGECVTYSPGQRATATLTFAAPLAPNLPRADRTPDIVSYSFSDGVRTTTGPGSNAATYYVEFATDAAGLPTNYELILERTPGPPYLSNTPSDSNSYFSLVQLAPSFTSVIGNGLCSGRSAGFGAVTGPGACDGAVPSPNSSAVDRIAPTSVALSSGVAAVPTMSEWAMILFGTILAGGAALYVQRRRFSV